MYKHILRNIQDIEIWPVISLTIFFIFFVCLVLWVIKVDKKYIGKMESMPLDDGADLNSSDTLKALEK
ncbi:MAG: cytochrome C oxidase Cbb3 [Bacteroidota bacterium]